LGFFAGLGLTQPRSETNGYHKGQIEKSRPGPVPGEFRICRHFHPRVPDELSQSFDFPIFKRSNQIETGLFKGESENRQSDALRHCSILFACLTLTKWQSFMPLLAFDRVRDNAAIDMT
jgi:hypothetical protein